MAFVKKNEVGRWEVILTDDEVEACRARAERWREYRNNSSNLFGGSLAKKLQGIKGELAFQKLLENRGLAYTYGGRDGQADEWDFRIDAGIVSLKTQASDRPLSKSGLLFLNRQQSRHNADYYVFACCLGDYRVEFLGAITKVDFLSKAKLISEGQPINPRHPGSICLADMFIRRAGCLKPLDSLFEPSEYAAQDGEEQRH